SAGSCLLVATPISGQPQVQDAGRRLDNLRGRRNAADDNLDVPVKEMFRMNLLSFGREMVLFRPHEDFADAAFRLAFVGEDDAQLRRLDAVEADLVDLPADGRGRRL